MSSSAASVAPTIAAPGASSSSKPKRALKRHSAQTPKRFGFKRAQLRRMAVRAHCTGITRKFTPQLDDYLTRVTTALVKTAIILAGDKKTLQVNLVKRLGHRENIAELANLVLQTRHLAPAIERVFASDQLRGHFTF